MSNKSVRQLRDGWRSDLGARVLKAQASVTVGRRIEYTETDRQEIQALAEELLFKVKHAEPGVAQLILRLFKITQLAIARSHAS